MHVVLKGISQNDVLREFSELISDELRSHVESVLTIDLMSSCEKQKLLDLLIQNKVKGILSFNGVLGDKLPADFNVPFISWLVDSPIYHYERLINNIKNRHTIVSNSNHLNFLKQAQIKGGASTLLVGGKTIPKNFSLNRIHTILMVASWMGEPEEFWTTCQDPIERRIAEKVVEILDADKSVNAMLACNLAAKYESIEFKINHGWIQLAADAQTYIRKKDRINIVKEIEQTKIPFTLIGDGWENKINPGSNVKIIASMNNKELSKYYSESKIVINLNAANGACERLFEAMSAGASVISDHSNSLIPLFKDRKDLVFFDRRKLSTLTDAIDYLLKDDKYKDVALRSNILVNENHLWKHRASNVAEIFKKMNNLP